MKRLVPLFKMLGNEFNSEHTETVLLVKRAPFEGDLRKLVSSTEKAIRVTTRIETWEFLWWSGHSEKSWVTYHIVHHLQKGGVLAYAERVPNTTIVDYHKLERVYADSLKLVFAPKS